ncbi:alpha/beta hydrolase [Altericista sp. CCNU0014]|uniref:alpha/beta hydrolase n=1 Tax=Altericista sp. CCNU0014 TaxID=3082949 RepID=UPI00384D18C1
MRNVALSLNAIAFPSPPLASPMGRLVGLHGWGSNAQDLASLAPYLDLKGYQYVFPNGPMPHPDVPGGRMWYDLSDFATRRGLPESRQQLTDWLLSLESVDGVPLNKTFLTGFSQGGAMTLDVGTHLPVAGLVVLSGYLHPLEIRPLPQTFPPILMIHGLQDTVVQIAMARKSHEALLQAGAKVQYHELEMAHEIQPEVMKLIQDFVQQQSP